MDKINNTRDVNELMWVEKPIHSINGSFTFKGKGSLDVGEKFAAFIKSFDGQDGVFENFRYDYSHYPIFEKKVQ